jgi:hypothetical protein
MGSQALLPGPPITGFNALIVDADSGQSHRAVRALDPEQVAASVPFTRLMGQAGPCQRGLLHVEVTDDHCGQAPRRAAGQFGQVDQPVRIPAGPVVIGAIDNPEDTMVGLACLMGQVADLLQDCCHLIVHDSKPRDHQVTGGPVGRNNGQAFAAAYAGGGVNPPMRSASARANLITVRSRR